MYDWWICNSPDDATGGGTGGEDETPDDDSQGETVEDPGGQDEQVPKSELARANKEAAKYRRQLREVQSQLQELEGTQKSDLEKAMDQAKSAEERAKALERSNAHLRVRLLAEEVGIVREARTDAAQLLNWEQIEDPTDDDQVVSALKELVKDRPYLLGTTSGADGGAGQGRGAKAPDMNQILRSGTGRA